MPVSYSNRVEQNMAMVKGRQTRLLKLMLEVERQLNYPLQDDWDDVLDSVDDELGKACWNLNTALRLLKEGI